MSAGYDHEDPFDEGYLHVSDLHRIYYHQYGKQDGKTALFVHGGPGGATSKANTNFFDPSIYRVVLFDQRGAGKSTPTAEVRENTTQLLISDIETLWEKLQIKKWDLVFGGSWGSLLSLAYAESHPESVSSLLLRGIMVGEPWEFDWTLRGGGPAVLFPDKWADFIGFLPEHGRSTPMRAYHEMLTSDDKEVVRSAARSWNAWELSISTLTLADDAYAKLEDETWSLQHARIEAHYFMNDCFLKDERALLKPQNIEKIRHIPLYMVQGRYDVVCPPKAAWMLHQAMPESKLYWSPDAGHSALEPATRTKLIQLCDDLGK